MGEGFTQRDAGAAAQASPGNITVMAEKAIFRITTFDKGKCFLHLGGKRFWSIHPHTIGGHCVVI
jgi:hypothetical protein